MKVVLGQLVRFVVAFRCGLGPHFGCALTALIVSGSLVSPGRAAGAIDRASSIHIQLGGEPSTLDPARVIDQYGFGILRNVVEGLLRIDSTGQMQNGLAESYEISKDQLTYHFKIKPTARWSDGKAVLLDDFVFGLRHALDPKTASPNANYFFAIKNARAAFKGDVPLEQIGVKQVDGQLVIELEHIDPDLLLALTLPAATPARRDLYAANSGKWNFHFATTGDYTIQSYRVADQIELKRNPFRDTPAKTERVVYHLLPEEITAMNLFESGRMDVVSTVTASEIAHLKEQGVVHVFPSTTIFYLSYRSNKAPFDSLEWRRAFASVIDRGEIAKLLHGAFEPSSTYVPKTIEPAISSPPLHFAEAVAKVRAQKDKPRLRLAFGASEFTRLVAEKLQNDFKEKLGIQLILEPMDLKTLLGRLVSDPPDMYFLGMSALFADPINHLNAFSVSGGENFSRYHNLDYEKILDQIKLTPLGEARSHLVQEANSILVERDVAVIPVVGRLQVFAVSPRVGDFQVSPYQVIGLKQMSKAP